MEEPESEESVSAEEVGEPGLTAVPPEHHNKTAGSSLSL